MAVVLLLPIVLVVFTLTRPPATRKRWRALSVAAALISGLAFVALTTRDSGTRAADAPVSVAEAPEGGRRSGDGRDVADVEVEAAHDELDRSGAGSELLDVLAALTVAPEAPRTGYDRDLFDHWDDEDGDGCDTRCEVLSAQRRPDGFWLSEWDGYSTDDPSELHVDHVVALSEAWDSGAHGWSDAARDAFADDRPNLIAVSAAANLRKSDRDAAEWFPSRAEANCLWASTVVRVKHRWDLTVDTAEAEALGNLLRTCGP
ncbi:MAG: GmrSD restriction endonuclease domain-containing protein [Microthrixaceae bacterium]